MIDTIESQTIPVHQLLFSLFVLAVLITGVFIDAAFLAGRRRRKLDLARLAQGFSPRPWTMRDGMTVLAFLIFIHLVAIVLFNAFKSGNNEPGGSAMPTAVLAHMSVLYAAGLGLIVYLIRSRRLTWNGAFGLKRRGPAYVMKQAVLFLAATLPLFVFAAWVNSLLLELAGHEIKPQPVITLLAERRFPLWSQVTLALMAVTLAPAVEELLFRGVAMPIALKHTSPFAAICLVSVIFAELHFHLASLLPLFVLAFGLSVAYLYTGSIAVPIVMHALFNAFSMSRLLILRILE
ncbi:MAG: CPBP family intramembrane glutamic endopeptidase [Kiritimatiellia bacterium]